MKIFTKRTFLILCTLVIAVNLSGCASLKRKFTRKRKAPQKQAVYYQVRKYDIKPSMELYEKHYVFWSTWQSKITAELGRNFKNDIRCMQEIVSNLEDMYALLVDEKANELAPHIEELKKARVIIDKRTMTNANETRIRRILEREDRVIGREFAPRKMKGSIREDWRSDEQ